MRAHEPGHVMAMAAVAQACFKSDIDHDLAVRAAKAVLRVIDTASSSASQPAVNVAKFSLDAACSGGALALARANHDGASSQGNRSVAEAQAKYQAMKKSLTQFNLARSALGEDAAAMLHGWDSWKAAADWADTEMKSLATDAVEHHARQVQAAVGDFSPGGKTRALGGSCKAGMPDDAAWPAVVREMESCFWSQPQALAALREGAEKLKASLQVYTGVCAELDVPEDGSITKTAKEAMEEAYCTMAEEYFVSKCQAPGPATRSKISKRMLDIASKFEYSMVHAAIRAQVSRFQL